MKILTFLRELGDESAQLLEPAFCGANWQAFLAAWVTARLAGIQPELDGSGEQPVRDVPEVGLLVTIGYFVSEVDRPAKGFIEEIGLLLHGID
jgi:hypothetical protein